MTTGRVAGIALNRPALVEGIEVHAPQARKGRSNARTRAPRCAVSMLSVRHITTYTATPTAAAFRPLNSVVRRKSGLAMRYILQGGWRCTTSAKKRGRRKPCS